MKPKTLTISEALYSSLKSAEIHVNGLIRDFHVKYRHCFNLYRIPDDERIFPGSAHDIEKHFEDFRHSVYLAYQLFKKAAENVRKLCAKVKAGDTSITTTRLLRAFARLIEAKENALQIIQESALRALPYLRSAVAKLDDGLTEWGYEPGSIPNRHWKRSDEIDRIACECAAALAEKGIEHDANRS